MYENSNSRTFQPERAFLVEVEVRDSDSLWGAEDSLDELAALAQTAGAEVTGRLIQHLDHPNQAYYMGKGRALELAQLKSEYDLDLVIFDDELSPSQQRNLEKILNVRIIDRTALILDIFAQRARTREGSIQVELAQYQYMLPRLSGKGTSLSRMGGGSRSAGAGGVGGAIGARGPGETKLESDRRRIRHRIATLQQELGDVRRQRGILRQQRAGEHMPVIAIVGYTNAGKSTLFNSITSASVPAENKLFATLDPTTRRVVLPNHQEVLFIDTVGFIQKLPTQLVAAFRATLEEVTYADILLEVVDITHPNAFEQSQIVTEVLHDLNAEDKPRVTALNKVDLLDDLSVIDPKLYPNAVPISAVTLQGVPELYAKIAEVLSQNLMEISVTVPFERSDAVELFHRRGQVASEKHSAKGTTIDGKIPGELWGIFQPWQRKPATRHLANTRETAQD